MPTTRRRRRAHSGGVPSIHLVLIIITFAVVGIGFVGHLLRPDDQLSNAMVTLGLGALFGKLTNGFGKSVPILMGGRDTDGDGTPDAPAEAIPNGKDG